MLSSWEDLTERLVTAGGHSGLTVHDMIAMLNAGLTASGLLDGIGFSLSNKAAIGA